jgi:hypothetical protein
MPGQKTQSYENHVKVPAPVIVHAVVLLVAAGMAVAGLFMPGTIAGDCLVGTGLLATALVLIFALGGTRRQLLILQDRIIRLEMQVRLGRLLPGDLQERAGELTLPQLIALRFASDAELPDLARRVLEGDLKKPDAIKQAVKDWQSDHQRV